MKKWMVPAGAAAIIILMAAGLVIGALTLSSSAVTMQGNVSKAYHGMRENLGQTTLVVTENGEEVGTYGLAELGILEDTKAAVEAQFSSYDRMKPEAFAQTSIIERLKWRFAERSECTELPVSAGALTLEAVLRDLDAVPREPPQDARMEYADGSFYVLPEVAGSVLVPGKVEEVLTQTVKNMAVTATAPRNVTLELTEHDCYELPAVTEENGAFDFSEALQEAVQNLSVSVDFHGESETLNGSRLAELVSVDGQGTVTVREEPLRELVAQWHEKYRMDGVPYLFNAQVGGVKPIDFLKVDYEVDQQTMLQSLKQAILTLEPAELEADWYCWREGEAFAIKDNYVEVDIPNQKMTYVKDGEVLVSTDVVTGASWGYPTPPGYYKVENKDTNCWLQGEDYNVHVDYWIGFIGYVVGIHDADWRTKFGGTNYVKNGSHGCVNTPKEATATIFENIDIGVPVLVYGK